jgi:hypothetical protein
MENDIKVEATIHNLKPEAVKREQKQELFECIRHFMKYLSFENISEEFKAPEAALLVREAIVSLYEHHYEKNANEEPA